MFMVIMAEKWNKNYSGEEEKKPCSLSFYSQAFFGIRLETYS